MSQVGENSAWNTVRRLFELVRYLSGKDESGASFGDIARDVYGQDVGGLSESEVDALKKKFYRDRKALGNIYCEKDISSPEDEFPDDGSVIIKLKRGPAKGNFAIRSGMNFMLPMRLTEAQALTLTTGVRMLPYFIEAFAEPSRRLWDKLQRQIPKNFMLKCEALVDTMTSALPMVRGIRQDVFIQLLNAASRKKTLKIHDYMANNHDRRAFTFYPQLTYVRDHLWYVLGERQEQGGTELTTLRVDQILNAEIIEQDQPHPLGERALKALRRDIQLGLDPCVRGEGASGKEWHVRLRITEPFASVCMEAECFPGERKHWERPGKQTVLYEVTLKGLDDVALWVMRALDCMEILEPAELREEIDERVRAYLVRRVEGDEAARRLPLAR